MGPPGACATALRDGPRPRRAGRWARRRRRAVVMKVRARYVEPVRVGLGVVVDVGDDLSRRRLEPDVAGGAQPAVLLRITGRRTHSRSRASRPSTVVDDDDLVVGVVEGREACRSRRWSRAPLCEQTTTEMAGHADFGGEGHSANARATAASAGFGLRSRRSSPNASPRRRAPPRNHSSVQEKTTAPAQPEANVVRTCQLDHLALPSSPWRRLSSPSSRDEERPIAGEVVEPREVGLERSRDSR